LPPQAVIMPRIIDLHLHPRENLDDDRMLDTTIPAFRGWYEYVVPMPNSIEPIREFSQVRARKGELVRAGLVDDPDGLLMTFQLTRDVKPIDIGGLCEFRHIAGKVYPAGMTTNSQWGIEDYFDPQFLQNLAAMETLEIPALFHCEKPGANPRTSEVEFLAILEEIIARFPNLTIVFEHVSTREGIEFVRRHHRLRHKIFATLTLHHATSIWIEAYNHDGSVRNPYLVVKPCLQSPDDRDAVFEAMISGEPCFGFGSDSAPHPTRKKEGPNPPSGIFTPPQVAYGKLAEIFASTSEGDWALRMYRFASLYATCSRGLSSPTRDIRLVRQDWTVPSNYNGIVPFMADKRLHWLPELI